MREAGKACAGSDGVGSIGGVKRGILLLLVRA
jgi:hypothetical protein